MRVVAKLVVAFAAAAVLQAVFTANVTYEAVFTLRSGLLNDDDEEAIQRLVDDYRRHYGLPANVEEAMAAAGFEFPAADQVDGPDSPDSPDTVAPAAQPGTAPAESEGGQRWDCLEPVEPRHDPGGACCRSAGPGTS